MANRHVDVVVIGAGPAGSIAALELARRNLHALLLDSKRLPRVKVCAGGISPHGRRLLHQMGLWNGIRAASYRIEGLRLVESTGLQTVVAGTEVAAVLARSRLDAMLARAAARAGAELRDGLPARGLLREGGRVVGVRTDEGDIRARWVVAADGANTRFSKDPRPRNVLQTCMGWFEGLPFTPHVVEMIFDPALAPHYGWLFPEAPDRVNVGICVQEDRRGGRSLRDLFHRFLDTHFAGRLAGARPIGHLRGHPIVVTASIRHHAEPGVLLVGEACRLVNAANGEGISHALQSGMLAARAIADGMANRADPDSVSSAYLEALQLALAFPLGAGDLARRQRIARLERDAP